MEKKKGKDICHICGSTMYFSAKETLSCPICGNEEQQKKPD